MPRALAAAKSDDDLVLSWNRSLSGPELESAPKLEPTAWQPVPVETAGRAALPLAGAARFLRLAWPGVSPGPVRVLQELPGPNWAVAFRGDADHLVVVDAGGPRLWPTDDSLDRPENPPPARFTIETAAVSADGAYVLCAGALRARSGDSNAVDEAIAFRVRLADMRSDAVPCNPALAVLCSNAWRGADVSAGGDRILLTNGGNEVVLVQATAGEFQSARVLPGTWPVAFSPDGSRAVTCYYKAPGNTGPEQGGVDLWNLADGRQVLRMAVGAYVSALAFSPDGTRLATGSAVAADNLGEVWVWSLDAGSQDARRFQAGRGAVRCLAFSPDGRHLLAADAWTKTARLWRLDTGALLRAFEGHPGAVTAVTMSPDNRWVATGTEEGLLLLWDVSDLSGR